uniref:Cilia- and flagella-associated protein 206 n=1 Tax=Rhabditophanes sp. KR3021 TaxID=114890 RepID=A0AC35U273_9BILA
MLSQRMSQLLTDEVAKTPTTVEQYNLLVQEYDAFLESLMVHTTIMYSNKEAVDLHDAFFESIAKYGALLTEYSVFLMGDENAMNNFKQKWNPLAPKEVKCNDIWKRNQKVGAVYLDGLHINQVSGIEYLIIFKIEKPLINYNASGQSNEITYLRHPSIVTKLSKLHQ